MKVTEKQLKDMFKVLEDSLDVASERFEMKGAERGRLYHEIISQQDDIDINGMDNNPQE